MSLHFKRMHLALAVLAAASAPAAFAAGTSAGTDISNIAKVKYDVGGVPQPEITSTAATFKVDRKINLVVAEVGGTATAVVPGATGQVSTFTVTNSGNSTLDFLLSVTQDNGGTAAHGGTDNFDLTAIKIFLESGATAGYQPGEDTAEITYLDELAPDQTRTVYVLGNVPVGRVNADIAGLTLTATAAQNVDGSGAYVATAGAPAPAAVQSNVGALDNPNFVDTVFGDTAGDTDAAKDGRHSDDDQFSVVTASIAISKTATIVSDPFNGTSNPKPVPGAVVEYCLDVENTGSAAATAIVLTDVIPATTDFLPNSIKVNATGTGAACDLNSGSGEDDDDQGAGDAGDFTAGTLTVRSASLAAASRFKALFRVTVK